MLDLMTQESFRMYAICCSILALNLMIMGGMTAGTRAGKKAVLNKEDNPAKVGSGEVKVVEGPEHPDVARIQRAHRNALENIPIFFTLGLIYVLSGATPVGAKAYFITFTAARVLHSIVYIKGLQPWRTIFYAIGSLALVGMILQIGMAVFKH